MPAKLSERDIEKTCTDFLALDGWRSLKTDPVSHREWGKGFGEPGMADMLYIRYLYGPSGAEQCQCGIPAGDGCACAEVMWIEWKRAARFSKRKKCCLPTKAAPHQHHWHILERKRGALTLIAGEDFTASIEGFQTWYRGSGLMRRKI